MEFFQIFAKSQMFLNSRYAHTAVSTFWSTAVSEVLWSSYKLKCFVNYMHGFDGLKIVIWIRFEKYTKN